VEGSAPRPVAKLRAARLIQNSRCAVALTGAGISTASGIPDFRSPESGLWDRCDPLAVASLTAFRHHPERFYDWIRPLASQVLQARPNRAHLALAALEQAGLLKCVITQNIDDLHRQAGSEEVLELHGTFRAATCTGCFAVFPTAPLMGPWLEGGWLPRCRDCGSLLKPNVILFGEQIPDTVLRRARQWAGRSDLFLVVGSSLEVTPAACLPFEALSAGATLIIINREPTYLDDRAAVVYHGEAADVLSELVSEVLCERPDA
jgi:NAD-dependent deacetylase